MESFASARIDRALHLIESYWDWEPGDGTHSVNRLTDGGCANLHFDRNVHLVST